MGYVFYYYFPLQANLDSQQGSESVQYKISCPSDSQPLVEFASDLCALFPGVSHVQLTDNSMNIQQCSLTTIPASLSTGPCELDKNNTVSLVKKIKLYKVSASNETSTKYIGKDLDNSSDENAIAEETSSVHPLKNQVICSEPIPKFNTLHVILPALLPLPKYEIIKRKCQYPLSLDDPLLKKVPLYQKYSWLDVDSESESETKATAESSKEVTSSESLSDLKKFRMKDSSENEPAAGCVKTESSPLPTKRMTIRRKISNSICFSPLDRIAQMMEHFSDLDILSAPRSVPESTDIFMPCVQGALYNYNTVNIVQELCGDNDSDYLNFLAGSQCQKEKFELSPSLLDQHSTSSHNSAASLQLGIIDHMSHLSIVHHQSKLESCFESTPANEGPSLSVPDMSTYNNTVNFREMLSVNDEIISCLPLHHRLTISPDILAMIRQLARQDCINKAVNLMKRNRRKVVISRGVGALLSQAGVEGLSQHQLNSIANALKDV